ncbi:hypothetical protein [Glycomyces algeriensis]|uniref:Uncharacterized protein n=1 Tax=Glycomyces algeriensis TaxID=256037 RepID=A0A9W6LI55_9ACTN|nr:hypothetical protein [Glycomyces algeriensis]MDA1368818.1 hypothetical protein [Glycomyces algeriensis]MDR7350834.1 hypothetical protein [Glycomyces algeriensis]GLI43544.1 hypothetical protein GALLR39Z86_33940 [Glycomyces algeriensis]
MAYNPPPHYNLGGPSDPQQPQSAPPSYSPLQPQPYDSGYAPQAPVPAQTAPPPQGIPAQPGYGTQTFLQPPPPTAPRKSPAVVLLAIGMVVGLAAAAVSIALWLRATGDLEDAEARLSDRDDQISQLQEDLEAAQAQVADLEGPAAEAEAMQACIDDLNDYYSSAEGSEEETAALDAIDTSCDGYIF